MSNSTIPTIDVLTDTWQTAINRINSLITSLSTEIITANSTNATTGSPLSPRNAALNGVFSANTITTIANTFSVNNSILTLGNQLLISANNSTGAAGLVLASGGPTGNIYWKSAGTGTVSSITAGSGLNGGTVNATGTFSVMAGNGIIVNGNGVSVSTSLPLNFISANNSLGTSGYVLKSGGPVGNTYWDVAVANGAGLVGTSTLSVLAGNGITVDANGVSVSSSYVPSLFSNSSFSNNSINSGYTKLPNGLVLQWATFTGVIGSYISGYFPVSFSNSCMLCSASYADAYINNGVSNLNIVPTSKYTYYITWSNAYNSGGSGDTVTIKLLALGF